MKTKHRAPFLALLLSLSALSAAGETVEIRSAADWTRFATRVNAGETDLDARMTADVVLGADAPRVGGTKALPWTGDFDGNGKKLTIAFQTTATGDDRDADLPAAPFAYVGGKAKVHDLHVAGTAETSGCFASGVFGWVVAAETLLDVDVRIENCRVSVAITCTIAGAATSGGFVGAVQKNAMLAMVDCLFDGSLLGENANSCGGLVGFVHDTAHSAHASCLFAPSAVAIGTDGCQTLVRPGGSNSSCNDCYYTQAFGAAQGSDASSMSAEDLAAALGDNWQVVGEGGVDRAVPKFTVSVPDPDPNSGVLAFAYQGALRDAQGGALPTPNHTIEFRLYDQASGGSPHWGRRHGVLLDEEGNFAVELSDAAGEEIAGVPGTGLADALARNAASAVYLGLAVDGEPAEISPRQKLLAVPAASFASDAGAASGDMAVDGDLAAGGARASGTVGGGSLETPGGIRCGSATAMSDALVGGALRVSGTISGAGTFPLGGIIPWHGQENQVPKGWAVCNGQVANGRRTPDLSSRFVVGSGRGTYADNATNYAIGAQGGEERHTLAVGELPAHSHNTSFHTVGYSLRFNDSAEAATYDSSGKNNGNRDIQSNSAGGGGSHENRPPYYALLFIMRVE